MSAPIIKTFLVKAKVRAVFTEMVVFPSPLIDEEIRMTGHFSFLLKKYLILEFRILKDSANEERSFTPTVSLSPYSILGISATTGISLAISITSYLECT